MIEAKNSRGGQKTSQGEQNFFRAMRDSIAPPHLNPVYAPVFVLFLLFTLIGYALS